MHGTCLGCGCALHECECDDATELNEQTVRFCRRLIVRKLAREHKITKVARILPEGRAALQQLIDDGSLFVTGAGIHRVYALSKTGLEEAKEGLQ